MVYGRNSVDDVLDNSNFHGVRPNMAGVFLLNDPLQFIYDRVMEYPSDSFSTEDFIAWLDVNFDNGNKMSANKIVDIFCRINIIKQRGVISHKKDRYMNKIQWERNRKGWDSNERGGIDIFANAQARVALK